MSTEPEYVKEARAFYEKANETRRKTVNLMKWVIGLLFLWGATMTLEGVTTRVTIKRQVVQLEEVIVPYYDIVSLIGLLDLKMDMLYSIQSEDDKVIVREQLKRINDQVYNIIDKNVPKRGPTRSNNNK